MSYLLGPTSFKALDRIRAVGEKYGYRLFINFDAIAVNSCDMKYDFEEMYDGVREYLIQNEIDEFMDIEDSTDREAYLEDLLENNDIITGDRINIQLEPTEKAERKDTLYMSFGEASVYIIRLEEEFRESLIRSFFDLKDPDVSLNYPYRPGIVIGCFGQHLEKYFGEENITSDITF